jgi:heterodisulfide reductase subunit D
MSLENAVKGTNILRCLECKECVDFCTVAKINPAFSPSSLVHDVLFHFDDAALNTTGLWSCLTCGRCEQHCPYGVKYTEFVKQARIEAFKKGKRPLYSHHGLLQTIMSLMTKNINQNRTGWLNKELKTSEKSEYFYFTGCLPYFEVIFDELKVPSLDIARNTVAILNHMGIKPIVSQAEKCCGHDLLWSGDWDSFKKLAIQNLKLIKESGAKKVIFSCPECYKTFKEDYLCIAPTLPFQTMHLTELVAEKIHSEELSLQNVPLHVTYQDSCRLGKLYIYQQPRDILNAIPELEFKEMERNREESLCCGTNSWINCMSCNRQIQFARLEEAQRTGAEALITSCPKCQIHFRCALSSTDNTMKINILDITSIISQSLLNAQEDK